MTDDNATRLHIEPIGVTLIAEDGKEFLISESTTVGRSKDAGLMIDDDQISRRHAQLKPLSDGLEVEDLGSSNGTFLNGQRLPKFVARHGDILHFYMHKYSVSIRSQQAPAFDPEATRLHIPEAAPAPVEKPLPAEKPVAVDLPSPAPKAVVSDLAGDKKPADEKKPAGETKPADADKTERAWWETSDEGPVGTVLLRPGEVDLEAEMTRLFNLGPAQTPRLVGMAGEYSGRIFELGEGKFVIGREAGCAIRLDNDGISVKHAQIIHEGDTWKLVNLLSSNGTFVNSERIQTAYLNSGDELRFGSVALLFQLPGGAIIKSAEAEATAAEPKKSGPASKTGLIAAIVAFLLVLVVGALVLL